MKNIFILLFLATLGFAQAQDTTYYTDTHKKVSTLDSATTYEVKVRDSKTPVYSIEKTYTKAGQLTQTVAYKEKNIDGHYIKYWPNQKLRRDDEYKEGKFVRGKCYNHQGEDTTYFVMEQMPEFPGGPKAMMEYIRTTIHYPESSKEAAVQGKVFVKYVIEKDGSITNIEILKGVNDELNAEAIRVVKGMPNWKPGMQEGQPVRVYFNLPLNFRLQ